MRVTVARATGYPQSRFSCCTACHASGKNFSRNSLEISTGAINPPSAHSPTLSCAQITMSGPLPTWAAIGKLLVIFSGVSIVTFHPKIGVEFLNDWIQSSPSLGIHPDQKFAIGPGEKVDWEQIEDEENRRHFL